MNRTQFENSKQFIAAVCRVEPTVSAKKYYKKLFSRVCRNGWTIKLMASCFRVYGTLGLNSVYSEFSYYTGGEKKVVAFEFERLALNDLSLDHRNGCIVTGTYLVNYDVLRRAVEHHHVKECYLSKHDYLRLLKLEYPERFVVTPCYGLLVLEDCGILKRGQLIYRDFDLRYQSVYNALRRQAIQGTKRSCNLLTFPDCSRPVRDESYGYMRDTMFHLAETIYARLEKLYLEYFGES